MISHEFFEVKPWCLRETALDLVVLAQTESVFALSNGHLGMRANLDEGEPHGLPGTYLNGLYETRPLPYAEAGYGYPEAGQSLVNVTNGKIIRLLVDDEPLDVRYGTLQSHERELDLQAGVLRRRVVWTSPAGRTIEIVSTRLVSLHQRAVAAISYQVTPLDGAAHLVIQSELVANEDLPSESGDPRAGSELAAVFEPEEHSAEGTRALLLHRTRGSGLRLAAAADHVVLEAPDALQSETEAYPDVTRTTFTAEVEEGSAMSIVKFVAYGWSKARTRPALRDQVAAALAAARQTGFDGLVAEQRQVLDEFWQHADVEVGGEAEVQLAVRFSLFHILQASIRAETRAIPAKGLTGDGYDGHTFWDSEVFVLPVLTFTMPDAVADALRWRHALLDKARVRATQLGLAGAAFPWRTIDGDECSAYWPAGTAAFHVNADIADAAVRYVGATGDDEFEGSTGLELVISTARLWRALGHIDRHNSFHIDGVTGPDEYSAVADDNLYTNLMAQANLLAAAAWAKRHPDAASELGVSPDEIQSWQAAAETMAIPYDDELGVHQQAAGFTRHEQWDFESTSPDQYPLMLYFPYFDLYRKKVAKQADLVLAMYLREDAFSREQRRANFDYYEKLTVRDSSLSAPCQAVVAADVGHLDLAYAYLHETAFLDLEDLQHNTNDGLHLAALAGSWLVLVAGFAGMRQHGDHLSFSPRLPRQLESLVFNIRWRGRHLRVGISGEKATFLVADGEPLNLDVCGKTIELATGETATCALEPPEHFPPPRQPAGREPGSGTARSAEQ